MTMALSILAGWIVLGFMLSLLSGAVIKRGSDGLKKSGAPRPQEEEDLLLSPMVDAQPLT